MLPKELTAEQNKIPSLTETLLKRLGFKTNHEWKLNAHMLGFNIEEDIDDFIEELTTITPKTFLKGDQLVCYIYEDNVKNLKFPIAFEGNVLFSEEWKIASSSEWKRLRNFAVNNDTSIIYCSALMEGLTGDLHLTYGKKLKIDRRDSSQKQEEFKTSLEHISKSLKEIDARNREMQFVEKNFQPTATPKKVFKIIH